METLVVFDDDFLGAFLTVPAPPHETGSAAVPLDDVG